MSSHVPIVIQKRLWPTWFMPAAFGLVEGEAPPLGDTDPLGEEEDDAEGDEDPPAAFCPSHWTKGQVVLLSVDRVE